MNEHRGRLQEAPGKGPQLRLQCLILLAGQADAAGLPDALLPEVVPLPAVELRTEAGHQADVARGEARRRECVQPGNNGQGLLVESAAEVPGGIAAGEEVLIPEVLHQQEPPLRIVAEDIGNRHADSPEKTGDRGVICVLLARIARNA